jgi:hypothetical protein
LQDKYSDIGGLTKHHLIKKLITSANTIGGVITKMNILTPLHLFVMTSPIKKAVASGKGNSFFLHKNDMFKLQKTFDRHNARQKLTYLLLSDPRHFSLPSTFKGTVRPDWI